MVEVSVSHTRDPKKRLSVNQQPWIQLIDSKFKKCNQHNANTAFRCTEFLEIEGFSSSGFPDPHDQVCWQLCCVSLAFLDLLYFLPLTGPASSRLDKHILVGVC